MQVQRMSSLSVKQVGLYMSRSIRKCVLCHIRTTKKKGADQPALPRSLISAFVVLCLYSIISLDSIADISRL